MTSTIEREADDASTAVHAARSGPARTRTLEVGADALTPVAAALRLTDRLAIAPSGGQA